MIRYLRPTWIAVTWTALLLALLVFAAGQTALSQAPSTRMVAVFEDINGNDIDDSCEEGEVADADAAAAAEAAVDVDGDKTISVSEAARSDRIGGKNCNHGGYVSWVAHGSCGQAETPAEQPEQALVTGPTVEVVADEESDATDDCADEPDEESAEGPDEDSDGPTADCEEVAAPERDPALDDQKNAHGKWVSSVARSDAIGGKNCNHGGAVSEAAKKDRAAEKAERDTAKAERKAERDAAKAERKAARDEAKAAKNESKVKKH